MQPSTFTGQTPLQKSMQQVVSNRHTLLIQFWIAIPATIGIVWASYTYGIAPNWSGLLGWVELLAWNAVGAFLGLSVVGIVMYAVNLLFYLIQVQRHGKPSENIVED